MSDTLSTLTGLAGNLPGLGAIANLAAGLLSTASWRGVPFYMVTGEEEAGHRTKKFLFPGQATAAWEFLGPVDGPIHVEGILFGADCVAQAARLRAAVQAGGPGKLRHPWYGEFDAVVSPDEMPKFSVAEAEFGLVRFAAAFERYTPATPPATDFFGQLQADIDGLLGQATDLMSSALSAISGPLALYSFASGLLASAAVVWSGLGVGSGGSAIAAAVAPSVLALTTAAPAFDDTFADTVAALLLAPAAALADASQPATQAVIGAGPEMTPSAPPIDPASAAQALLQASAALAGPATASPYQQAISLAAQMQAVGQAASVGSTIDFADTEDAAAWSAQIGSAIAGVQAQVAQLAVLLPIPAAAAWRSLDAARQSAIADIAARAVNLPSLLSVTTTRVLDAWTIALQLYGDTPALMQGAVVDLWARNRTLLPLGNPAVVPPGTYAVLST